MHGVRYPEGQSVPMEVVRPVEEFEKEGRGGLPVELVRRRHAGRTVTLPLF